MYFGVAILVGVCTGALLHYSTTSIANRFELSRSSEEGGGKRLSHQTERPGKQARKYRYQVTALNTQNGHNDARIKGYAEWLKKDTLSGKRGLLSTTILEEDDSSEASF